MTSEQDAMKNGINIDCLKEFPKLESERLIFREVTNEDAEDIFNIYRDPEVARYDWFTPILSMDKAINIINSYREEFDVKEEITWGVARKTDNKIIGYCSLGDFKKASRSCYIGYGFNSSYWNKGYGTETIKTLIKFAFDFMNINRIEAEVTLGNDASVKVLKKSGFVQEGILRQRTFIKGTIVDDVILAMLKSDYEALI